ncbi:Retrovirus-related Pol polyprotein from transposon 17.6 [Araneus ventricosus]|uniref:RNA-directed DNA polymerase n=1 Tax=Araneus ventricosus TaxID=182803 RepID=A0A4Y2MMG5_ARAVE|nr:Retrovirus-related Pol polyprotein from transposon 17.6 [Araneus ventricosus]
MNPACMENVNGSVNKDMDKRVCPARDARCRQCSKIGHYAKICITKSQTGCSEVAYLGVVQLESKNKTNIDWTVTVQVNHKNIKFKIDSGADHTVLPANVFQNVFQNAKLEPPDKILCGPDRNPLKTLGKFKTNIEYKGKSCTEEIYVISNLQTCLLGKPALFSLGLGPNLNSICQISAADPKAKFPKLFKGLEVMKGCYSIKLKPGAIPFAITSPRCVPIPFLKQTKAELERMVEEKVITPVLKPTEWCAPVVIVPKSDGNVRICVDLIELNKNVMRELHPLPKAEYSLNLLTGAKIFSKLDANSGFWQIPLDKKSSYLTTFITPFGRLRFQRLPFGISSAPEHFQRRVSQMLEGHIIDGQEIHPDPDKIAAVENYQPPTNKKELKQLLSMVNYLARFVPNYSDILFPLTCMLSNKVTFVWETPQEAAFQKLMKILSSDPMLMIFDPGKETTVTTDASSYGLGATICQKQADGRRSVIAYASRTLTPAESRYAQIEKKALAVAWGCEKFRDYLTGMHFKIETDHKPLIPIFSKKNLDNLSPRLQRIKLRMMKFSYTIVHIPGKELFAADALSRNPQKVPYKREELEVEIDAFIQMITSSLPASSRRLDELRVSQLKDETCQKLTDYVLKGWPSKKEADTLCAPYWQNRYEISVQDGLLMRGCRIIIPKSQKCGSLEIQT